MNSGCSSPLIVAIGVLVSISLILKTGTTDEVHILFVTIIVAKDSSQFPPLEVSVLGAIIRYQVLNKPHNLFWIPSVEVSV